MLTKVRITEMNNGTFIDIPINDNTGTFPFNIKHIEGLDPVPASISTTDRASFDGVQFGSAKVGARNIILTVGYVPEHAALYGVQALRRKMYGYAMPKMDVEIRLYSDEYPTLSIMGTVESLSAAVFGKDPVITISVLATDPYFKALSSVVVNGNIGAVMTINYPGDVPTGIYIRLNTSTTLPSLGIERYETQGFQSLSYDSPMYTYEYLNITTVKGAKTVNAENKTTGIRTNKLGFLNPASDWLELAPGVNKFRFIRPSGSSGNNSPISFTYLPRYGGF